MRSIFPALFASLLAVSAASAQDRGLSDQEIVAAMIAQSKAAYAGPCPCPENIDRAGRRCGKRSAHSRQGGEAPLCYASDVSVEMVTAFRKSSIVSAR